MIHPLRKIRQTIKTHTNVTIIIVAALLIELISLGQYLYIRQDISKDLERDAERYLTLKTLITRDVLNTSEKTLQTHMLEIQHNLHEPDSMFESVRKIVQMHPNAIGSGIAFVPYYYPQKGRLFEPYARRQDGKITVRQVAGENHDYTKSDFYITMLEKKTTLWTNPYTDQIAGDTLVTTLSEPFFDGKEFIGVLCLDITLELLDDTLNTRLNYPSSYCMLLTEDGKLISQPSQEAYRKHDIPQIINLVNDKTVERRKSNTECEIISFRDNQTHKKGTIFYKEVEGKTKWKLVLVCYNEEVYHNLYVVTVIVSCLMLIALIILSFIIHRFIRNERRLNEVRYEQERIASELRIATSIQMSMLPQKNDIPEDCQDMMVAGKLLPAKAVGGDLYDYSVRDGKLFFCIGDVSGKGVPAAMVMAVTRTLFRASAARENQPARIMQAINDMVVVNNERGFFVTLFVGILDLPTGRLRYCNAGHDAPILIGGQGGQGVQVVQDLTVKANLPVGIIEHYDYEWQECTISRGTSLFLFTDGLTEAMNNQHQMFGRERVMENLTSIIHHPSPITLLQTMTEKVQQFVDGAEQSDDLTMLAIRYMPVDEKYKVYEQLTLKNEVKEVSRLNQFVKDTTARIGLDTATSYKIRLALEEAVVNVINYAYSKTKQGEVIIEMMANDKHLRIIITDSGMHFDPTMAEKPDTTLAVEERPIGKMGILLMRELMDTINYERINGKNVLRMELFIKQPSI